MASSRSDKKHSRNVSAPTTVWDTLSQRKRPSVVDGKVLEPEWNLESQTFGSFNQETLVRIAQAQAKETNMTLSASELPHPQSPSARFPSRRCSMDWAASMQPSSSQQQRNSRYYSNNLSDEDKTALATGQLNHNLRVWSGSDLIKYHVSRIEMVPMIDTRQEIIADILEEKRESGYFVLKSIQQAKRFVGSLLTKLEIARELDTCTVQTRNEASRSMIDPRAAGTPNLPLSLISTTPQILQESFPFPLTETQNSRQSTYSGISINGGSFDKQSAHSSRDKSLHTSESSRNSSRNRGFRALDRRPLVRKADRKTDRIHSSYTSDGRPYFAKADVTFDSFLAPHTSGKGETHRDSRYVKKEPRDFHRPLSKMPSMPQLKKRASQAFSLGQKG